jgi:hypothetical protein
MSKPPMFVEEVVQRRKTVPLHSPAPLHRGGYAYEVDRESASLALTPRSAEASRSPRHIGTALIFSLGEFHVHDGNRTAMSSTHFG